MSRDGSGTYTLPAGNPVVTGTTISSTTHNNTMSDIATALTGSLAKDGQTNPTANLPMATFRHTGVGNAAARTDYLAAGQAQDGGVNYAGTVGGTADVITLTVAPAITAYAAGQVFWFTAGGTNTTNVTVNINSVGAKAITKFGTTALAAGDIISGSIVVIRYDGTQFQLLDIPDSLVAKLGVAQTFTQDQTIQSADAGATAGPILTLDRNSASPADGDVLGALRFNGRDNGAGTDTYAQIQAEIVDKSSGSEDGSLSLQTENNGIITTRVKVTQGIFGPGTTGSDQGANTCNFTVYDGGQRVYSPNNLVNQAGLNTTTASGSIGILTTASNTYSLTGGTYSWWTMGADNPTTSTAGLSFGGGNTAAGIIGVYNPDTVTSSIYVDERYVQSSPIYTDGPFFGFLAVDSLGKVHHCSFGVDPPWAYHGPTSIKPRHIDSKTGKKYALVKTLDGVPFDVAIKDPVIKRKFIEGSSMISEGLVEITMEYKDADKHIIPHPFLGTNLDGLTVIMFEPGTRLAARLSEMCYADAASEIRKDMLNGDWFRIGSDDINYPNKPRGTCVRKVVLR